MTKDQSGCMLLVYTMILVTVQVADLSQEYFKSSRVMRWWLSRLSSRFGAKSSRERKPKWISGLTRKNWLNVGSHPPVECGPGFRNFLGIFIHQANMVDDDTKYKSNKIFWKILQYCEMKIFFTFGSYLSKNRIFIYNNNSCKFYHRCVFRQGSPIKI